MNLLVVISMDFPPKDVLGRLDIGDIFSDTDLDQPALEPSIRPVHLPFDLWK